MSDFWHKVCKPKNLLPTKRVLLDVHLDRARDGWRITISQRFPGVEAFVNREKLKGAAQLFIKENPSPSKI